VDSLATLAVALGLGKKGGVMSVDTGTYKERIKYEKIQYIKLLLGK
jgi:hypothetical protein